MDKNTVNKLKLIITEEFTRNIEFYINHRLDLLHKNLEQATDFESVLRLQGQIQEVKRLKTLRDEVLAAEKDLLDGNKSK